MSLSKDINPSLVLVQPRKTRPFIIGRWLRGHKESNQTKAHALLSYECFNLSYCTVKVRKGAKIRNRYNQVPHLTQDTRLKRPLSKRLKIGFKTNYRLIQVKSIALCFNLCHSQKRPKFGFQDQLSLNTGQKYCRMLQLVLLYTKTCFKGSLSKRPKIGFKTNYHLIQVKSIAECFNLSYCTVKPVLRGHSQKDQKLVSRPIIT